MWRLPLRLRRLGVRGTVSCASRRHPRLVPLAGLESSSLPSTAHNRGSDGCPAKEIQEAIDEGGGPDPNFMASLGHVRAAQGRLEDARRLLDGIRDESKKSYVSSYHAAVLYAGLADKDRAFESLNQAAQERSTLLVYLRKDPRLAVLRSDPRFQALLDRVGLPG